jgi:hypothetical protein
MKKIIISFLTIVLLIPASSSEAAMKSLNTKANKASCKSIKKDYKSKAMSEWANGLANDEDVLKEIQSNIDIITSKQKFTSGKIQTTISSWINVEKNTKIALVEKDIKKITNAMNLKISVITKFDKLCKSIEK